MTCQSRSRGGGPKPSRAQDVKNTSGEKTVPGNIIFIVHVDEFRT